MEHFKIYSFLVIILVIAIHGTNAFPRKQEKPGTPGRIIPSAFESKFGREDFNRERRPQVENKPDEKGMMGHMIQFMQHMGHAMHFDFSDMMNGNFDEKIAEMMEKIKYLMQSVSNNFHKKQICYMNYKNGTDNTTGNFATACPINFNCVSVNETFAKGNYSVYDVKYCFPETNCSKMVCLPWEECRPPFKEEEKEDDDETIGGEEDEEKETEEEKEEKDEDKEEKEEDKKEKDEDNNEKDQEKENDGKKGKGKGSKRRQPGFKGMSEGFKGKHFPGKFPKYAKCVPKKGLFPKRN